MPRNEKAFAGAHMIGFFKTATVSIASGAATGTATIPANSTIIGAYPSGNADQVLKNVSLSGSTLTATLLANATAATTIKVVYN